MSNHLIKKTLVCHTPTSLEPVKSLKGNENIINAFFNSDFFNENEFLLGVGTRMELKRYPWGKKLTDAMFRCKQMP